MAVEGKQRWRNQSHFLQDRHGHGKTPSSEVIAVSLPVGPQAFDLLCWTVNVAARPGDSIIALQQQQQQHDASQESMGGNIDCKSEALDDAQFKPLRGLCDMKEVHMEVRISSSGSEERLLVDEVLALNATVLVVTTSGHHLQRRAQRKGSYLCKNLPSQCSVVVVRDYKVLFHKENRFTVTQKSCIARDTGSTLRIQAIPFTVAVAQNDQMNASVSCNKTPTQVRSPIGVLDGPDVFYESDDGADSGDHPKLLRSLSKKALITCGTSSHGEDDIMCLKQQCSCLNIWRKRKQIYRTFTFPAAAARHLKLAPIFIHCKSFGTSFRSYMSSLRIPKSLKTVNASTSLIISEKSWRIFSYDEVSRATNLFNKGNLIGKGGHSEVYKGLLCRNQHIAVKKLIQAESSEQKTMDFLTELGLICHTSHPNIIRLVGFCLEKGLYLVFHFLEHGSLASCLHGGRTPTLKWEIRYKVAVGTARGLNYLHSQCPRRIIHRDIKASNILLGPDFEPQVCIVLDSESATSYLLTSQVIYTFFFCCWQISDFGLAKWLPDQRSYHVPMPIEGTFGYLAPEYFMHGIVDEKTDVFAFGVLLLELITGRKPIEGLQSSLVIWARPFFESMNIKGLADVHLCGEYDPQEMQCMMMAAALCVQPLPQCRPFMSQVLQLLSDERNPNGVNAAGIFSSQSLYLQDPIFNDEYSSTHYHNDMRRHREIALQF